MIKIGVPDLVSNSYFPIIAAVEMGFLHDEGIDAEIQLLFPVTDAAVALRDGKLDFLAGAAHSPLYAFPEWRGAKLVAALSQNTYWFLVVRSDLGIARGDLTALNNLRIGAAPGVAEALRQLLVESGIDPKQAGIRIAPVPGTNSSSVSFGVTAAEALETGLIDAFWANGMGAEVALRQGLGTVIVDARRDGGPATGFTFPALSTTDLLIDEYPDVVSATVRALVRAQDVLRADPSIALGIGRKLFPPLEASLISSLVERDLPYYNPEISEDSVTSLGRFSRRAGLTQNTPCYNDVVATQFTPLWGANPRKEVL